MIHFEKTTGFDLCKSLSGFEPSKLNSYLDLKQKGSGIEFRTSQDHSCRDINELFDAYCN